MGAPQWWQLTGCMSLNDTRGSPRARASGQAWEWPQVGPVRGKEPGARRLGEPRRRDPDADVRVGGAPDGAEVGARELLARGRPRRRGDVACHHVSWLALAHLAGRAQ